MRKIIYLSILSVFLLSTPTHTQSALNTLNSQVAILTDFDSESITIAGTSIGFTAGTINPVVTDKPAFASQAQRASCQNTGTANINVITDSKAATTSMPVITPSGTFTVYGYTNITNFRAIRSTGVSSTIYCIYSRLP